MRQPKLHSDVPNPFTGAERSRLIERTEELLGRKLAGLIAKHRDDQREYPHRLIELHLRLLRAEDNVGDLIADDSSLVAGTEIAGVLDELALWRADPVWSEYQRGLNEAREYVHTATTLCFANALRTRHRATELVASGGRAPSNGRKETPDLRMVVTPDTALAVEVKTPTNIGSRPHSMTPSEATTAVRKALKEALKQLAGGPGMLVVGGFNIDAGSFAALGDAAGEIVERDGSESNLMAIVVANLIVAVGDPELGLTASEIGFGQKTRIRSNRLYTGPIEFVGDWKEKWELVPRTASRPKPIYVVRRRLIWAGYWRDLMGALGTRSRTSDGAAADTRPIVNEQLRAPTTRSPKRPSFRTPQLRTSAPRAIGRSYARHAIAYHPRDRTSIDPLLALVMQQVPANMSAEASSKPSGGPQLADNRGRYGDDSPCRFERNTTWAPID